MTFYSNDPIKFPSFVYWKLYLGIFRGVFPKIFVPTRHPSMEQKKNPSNIFARDIFRARFNLINIPSSLLAYGPNPITTATKSLFTLRKSDAPTTRGGGNLSLVSEPYQLIQRCAPSFLARTVFHSSDSWDGRNIEMGFASHLALHLIFLIQFNSIYFPSSTHMTNLQLFFL